MVREEYLRILETEIAKAFIAAYEENGVIKNEGLAYASNNSFNFAYLEDVTIHEI